MAKLARIYLAIQATSAPSERVFSTASLMITARRNGLGDKIAGKVFYVKQNWDQMAQITGSFNTLKIQDTEESDEEQ